MPLLFFNSLEKSKFRYGAAAIHILKNKQFFMHNKSREITGKKQKRHIKAMIFFVLRNDVIIIIIITL